MKMHLPICPSTRVAPFLAALVCPPLAARRRVVLGGVVAPRCRPPNEHILRASQSSGFSILELVFVSVFADSKQLLWRLYLRDPSLSLSGSQLAGRLAANNRWMCLPVTDNRCTSCLGCRPSLALFWPAQRPAASSVDLCWQWASSSAAGQQQQQQRKTQSSS